MDRRFLTVIGVSLLFALVVSATFYQVSARAGRGSRKPEKQEMSDIVVAAAALPLAAFFEVRALHLEPGVAVTDDLVADVAAALHACAAWHKTPEVDVRWSDPPELAALVQRAALDKMTR